MKKSSTPVQRNLDIAKSRLNSLH